VGEFEKHWLLTNLARKATTILTFAVLILAVTYSLSASVFLVHKYVRPFLPEAGFFGIGPFVFTILASVGVALLLAALQLYGEPKRIDAALSILDRAQEDDSGPGGEPLTAEEASQINHALEMLRSVAETWRLRGVVTKRVDIYWSPVLEQNACTYGGKGDEARVVFSADLLLPDLVHKSTGELDDDSGPVPRLTDGDRAGILAHELGHVENNDCTMGAIIGGVMRLLTYFYYPLLFVNAILRFISQFVTLIPFLGRFLGILVRWGLRGVISMALLFYRVAQLADRLQGQMREYVADVFAVKLMGSVDEILSALMALANFQIGVDRIKEPKEGAGAGWRATHSEAVRAARWDRYTTIIRIGKSGEPAGSVAAIRLFFENIHCTHPPMVARWNRLAQLGFQIEIDQREGRL
jgi:hypothetical protein